MTYYVYDDPIDLPSGSVRLTPSSPPGLTLGGPRYKILAASDDYFVMEEPKASTHPGYADGEDWGPTEAYSLDRRLGKWRSFTLQTPAADPFGDWLSTAVTVPGGQDPDSDNPAPRPGQGNEEREMGDCVASRFRPVMPDPVRAFSGTDFFTLLGAMQFTNLADGRDFIVHTGQEDSEVIAIDNPSQTVIYRVNDEIYSAKIEGSKLGAPTLLMKGCDVQNIHWAFWSNH